MKKVVFFTVTIVSLIIIKNLIFSIYNLLQKDNLIKSAREELVYQKARNKDLKEGLKKVASRNFIEEEARNKLLLVKPDEHDVLISRELTKGQSYSKKREHISNWRAWLDLFF